MSIAAISTREIWLSLWVYHKKDIIPYESLGGISNLRRNFFSQAWQHLLTYPLAFLEVRKAREDKLVNAELPIGQELVADLLWGPDNGGTAVDTHGGEAVPQMRPETVFGNPHGLCLLTRHGGPYHDVLALLQHA